MKTIKTKLAGFILLVLASASLFLTCDVGLGNSVDTKPPTVSITYPPVQSVIKNTFTMKGAGADETSLASVTVSVLNTVNAKSYGPYQATLDATAKSWSVVLNNSNAGVFEIPDGTYEMTVTAKDGAGRTSTAKTTYKIDNTPPVVVLERPGTVGPVASTTPEVYGTELKVTGSINDDNAVEKLVFTPYSSAGVQLGSPLAVSNISGTGMDVTLAKRNASASTSEDIALNNRYLAIYDNVAKGTQSFYCTISVSDEAREYEPPAAVASADNTHGNTNAQYYIYDEIYSTIFSASGDSVSMKDLTAIFNGTYTDTSKAATVKTHLAAKAHSVSPWSSASGTFSLNPDNSPKYEVMGLDPLSVTAIDSNSKSNATDLSIMITAGRDKVPLVPDSFRVYLDPCGGSGSTPVAGDADDKVLLETIANLGGDATAIADRNAKLTKSGSDYQVFVNIGNLPTKNNYLLKIEGLDQEGNSLVGSEYGFRVVMNGKPPAITFTSPASLEVLNHSTSFNMTGTVTSESGLTTLKADYSIKKVSDGSTVISHTVTGLESLLSGDAWSFPIDPSSDTATTDSYEYTVTMTAVDEAGNTTAATRVFYIDRELPSVEISSISPTVNVSGTEYANGNLNIKWRPSDNDKIASVDWFVFDGSNAQKLNGSISNFSAWTTTTIDTATCAATTGSLKFRVTVTDRAGNTFTKDTVVQIDQSTDKPVLAFSNLTKGADYYANNLGSTLVLNGTISDDDGVSANKILIAVRPDADRDGTPDTAFPATYAAVSGAPAADGSPVSFSHNLGTLAEGFYLLQVQAGDLNASAAYNASSNSWTASNVEKFVVDKAPPVVTIDQAQNAYHNAKFNLTGTAIDGGGISGFGIKNGKISVDGVDVTVAADGSWTQEIDPTSLGEGSHTVSIVAYDLAGQVSNSSFKYIKDSVAPTLTVSPATVALISGWQKSTNVWVYGTASDTYSGIKTVEYSTDSTDGENGTWTALTVTDGSSASEKNWTGFVTLAESASNKLFIHAVDNAGNITPSIPYIVSVDEHKPTLTETAVASAATPRSYNGNIIFRGTAADVGPAGLTGTPNSLTLSYSMDGTAKPDLTVPVTDFTGAGYVFPIDAITHTADGVYEFTLKAIDLAGNTTSVSYTVTVETKPPVITYNVSPSTTVAGTDYYNGAVDLKASISDDNTLANVYWQVSTTASPAYTQSGTTISGTGWNLYGGTNKNAWQDLSYNTATLTPAIGTQYVSLVAIDRFGNLQQTDFPMTVDQSTDKPVISYSNLTAGAGYLSNNLGATLVLNGMISDDDGVNKDKILIGVAADSNQDGVPDTAFSYAAVTGKPSSNGKQVSFSENLGSSGLNLPEGYYVLQVQAGDINASASTFDGSNNWAQGSAEKFVVDKAPPVVTINQAQNQFVGSSFTLSGTAIDSGTHVSTSDSVAYPDGTILINGATVGVAADGTWTSSINTAAFSQGANSITIVCSDLAGQTTNASFSFKKDTQNPQFDSLPAFSGWQNSQNISISGTASDPGSNASGVAKVEYQVNSGSWQSLSGTNAWSGVAIIPRGPSNQLTLRVTDAAGNAVTSSPITINVDDQIPTVSVYTPSSLIRVNGSNNVPTQFSAADVTLGAGLNSGVSTVKLKIASSDFSSPDATATYNSGTGYYETSIAASKFAALIASNTLTNGSQYSVYVQAADDAGNTAMTSFPILIDTSAPTAAITTPLANATVNKTITITGTGGDDQALKNVVLEIKKADTSWETIKTFLGTDGFNWSTSFNTETYGVAEYDTGVAAGIQLTIQATATDEAGNVSASPAQRMFTVDQDSDRPIVKLSNVNIDGSTILKMTGTVYGTVSDDDGVKSFRISEDGSNWTDMSTDGSWSYTASSGDGSKTLYFEVIDNAETTFITGGVDTPKIQYGASTISAPVTFKVDTLPPELSSSAPIAIDRTSSYDFADATSIAANMPLGGGSSGPYHQFKLRVLAKDANGIASVTVSLPGATGTPFTASANGADASEPTFTRFDTGLIDVSSMTDGVASITVTVTDNSGLASSVNRSVLIDNTAPTITHSSPRSLIDVVNGEVTGKGLSSDAGSGLANIRYQVGLCADRSSNSSSWTDVSGSLFSWEIPFTGTNKIDIYGGISVALDTGTDIFTLTGHGYANDTAVYFDGNTLATGMSSSTTYYVINASADTFQVSTTVGGSAVNFSDSPDSLCVSKYSKDTNNDGIWELPILIRAADTAGNVLIEDYSSYVALVDPSGDKPKASIVYPDPSNLNRTMGGTIRIFGTATDDDAVGSVYMQVDVDGDGSYTASDVDSTGKDWYAGGLGQVVSGTASWNQTINASGEFNPAGLGTRTIHFRVRSKDIYGTYGAWSADQTIIVDNKLPRIGSTNALTLTQGATSRLYVADMWIKGNWTLTGSVEDESDIANIQITGSVTGSLADNSSWFTHTSFGSNSGYTMAIPVSTSGTGSLTITIAATDKSDPATTNTQTLTINYDNSAPTDNGYTGSTPVVQSNKVYTLKGSVNESGSGFDKLAFYFERTPTTARVYNPMESRTGDANRTNMAGLTMVEGLPCYEVTGASRTNAYTLTSSSIIGNKNVRVGGLVNIGGLYRYILTINYTTGTITWADAVDTSVTSAYLAYAMVVNNTTVETPVWSGSTLTSITNDDGDGMVEAVERSGGLYSWTASIDSTNIPDGPIDIHYVAYDKAGNYTTGAVSTSIANNLPLLAKVTLGTDLNGNGTVTSDEQVTAFSALDGGGNRQQTATVLSSSFIAKDLTSVDIDVLGGNGILGYTVAYNSALQSGYNDPVTANILRATESGSVNTIYLAAASLSSIGDTIVSGSAGAAKSLVFKIWDSTEETARGTNSQYATLTVPMQIDVTDDVKPTASITPFYWNSASDNSLYGNSRSNGHIEISGVVDGTDPDVSGQVSIRGTAFDDTRLSSLWISIADSTPSTRFPCTGAAVTKTVGGRTYYQVATYNPSTATWIGTDQWSANGWKFTVTPVSLTQSGHTVSWQLDWDTSKVSGVAALNNLVRVLADDKRTTTNAALTAGSFVAGNYYRIEAVGTTDFTSIGALVNGVGVIFKATDVGSGTGTATQATPNASDESSTQTATGALTPYYSMDVVPYITGINTGLESGTKKYIKRTASGAYVIDQDENDSSKLSIRITGFNINPVASGITIGSNSYTSSAKDSLTYAELLKSSISASGAVSVTTNSIQSLNNVDSNVASYNLEADTYGPNFTDDRKLFVWDVSSTTYSGMTEAVMKPNLNTSGVKTGSMDWMYVKNAQSVLVNGNQLASSWTIKGGDFSYNGAGKFIYLFLHDMNWSSGSDSYQVCGSVQWGKGTDDEGGAYNWHRASQDRLGVGNLSFNGDANYAYGDKVMSRYQNLKLIADGTNDVTSNFVAYFDKASTSRSIVFWAFHTGIDSGSSFTHRTTLDNDGGTWYSDLEKSTAGTTSSDYSSTTNLSVGIRTPSTGISRVNVTSGSADSSSFDLKYDSARTNAYLVYYDETNSVLLLRYNNSPMTSPSAWSSAFTVDTAAGQYVKMAIDSNGLIHLAYFDSTNSCLKYALVTPTFDGSNNVTAFTVTKQVVVDALFTNGMYNSITLRNFGTGDDRPVICSYSITYGGTKNALKISWPLTSLAGITAGADASTSCYTGSWETVPVCSNYAPAQDNTFVETNGTGYTGNVVVGYNGSYLESATLLSGLY